MSDDNKITLATFADLVAARAKVSSAEANTYIHQLAKTISEELESGGDVHLYHFGRFHTTHVDEQAGHDPNSGEPLTIPAHSRVHFRPYSALRFAVNAPFRQLRIRELTPDKTAWRTRTGFWILLALLALLLIILGIWATGWVSPQDQSQAPSQTSSQAPTQDPSQVQSQAPSRTPSQAPSQAPPEMSSDKTVVAPTEQTPEAIAPRIATDAQTPTTTSDAEAPAAAPAESVKPETSPSPAATTEIVVSPGDTLWGIAATRLGDAFWWPIIYAENRPELPRRNPDLIESGITLRIPTLAGSVNNPTVADLRLRTNSYQIVAEDYQKLGNPRAAEYKAVAVRWSKE